MIPQLGPMLRNRLALPIKGWLVQSTITLVVRKNARLSVDTHSLRFYAIIAAYAGLETKNSTGDEPP